MVPVATIIPEEVTREWLDVLGDPVQLVQGFSGDSVILVRARLRSEPKARAKDCVLKLALFPHDQPSDVAEKRWTKECEAIQCANTNHFKNMAVKFLDAKRIPGKFVDYGALLQELALGQSINVATLTTMQKHLLSHEQNRKTPKFQSHCKDILTGLSSLSRHAGENDDPIMEQVDVQDLMRIWLRGRTDPPEHSKNHERAKALSDNMQQSFEVLTQHCGRREIRDPLQLCRQLAKAPSGEYHLLEFRGPCHGDLHGNNAIFSMKRSGPGTFQLIDFAKLEEHSFLFFDIAYLRHSLLANAAKWISETFAPLHQRAEQPENITFDSLNLLETSTSNALNDAIDQLPAFHELEMSRDFNKLTDDTPLRGFKQFVIAERNVYSQCIKRHEGSKDHVSLQWHLARIASGVNWAGKEAGGLSPFERLLIVYDAAMSAHTFVYGLRNKNPKLAAFLKVPSNGSHRATAIPQVPDTVVSSALRADDELRSHIADEHKTERVLPDLIMGGSLAAQVKPPVNISNDRIQEKVDGNESIKGLVETGRDLPLSGIRSWLRTRPRVVTIAVVCCFCPWIAWIVIGTGLMSPGQLDIRETVNCELIPNMQVFLADQKNPLREEANPPILQAMYDADEKFYTTFLSASEKEHYLNCCRNGDFDPSTFEPFYFSALKVPYSDGPFTLEVAWPTGSQDAFWSIVVLRYRKNGVLPVQHLTNIPDTDVPVSDSRKPKLLAVSFDANTRDSEDKYDAWILLQKFPLRQRELSQRQESTLTVAIHWTHVSRNAGR